MGEGGREERREGRREGNDTLLHHYGRIMEASAILPKRERGPQEVQKLRYVLVA